MTNGPNAGIAWLEDSERKQIPIAGLCSIGRSASNQLPLASQMVSRRHAIIQVQRDLEFWLVDFGSSNGTYVNHQRITRPTRLRDQDRLKIGPFEFVFRFPQEQHGATQDTLLKERTVADIRNQNCWLLIADIIDSTKQIGRASCRERV